MTARPPDLLVSRDGTTVAVRGSDGVLRLTGDPKDKYSAQEWLKHTGYERPPMRSARPQMACAAMNSAASQKRRAA